MVFSVSAEVSGVSPCLAMGEAFRALFVEDCFLFVGSVCIPGFRVSVQIDLLGVPASPASPADQTGGQTGGQNGGPDAHGDILRLDHLYNHTHEY